MNERILQIRTDALAAEYIYSLKLDRIEKFTTSINILTLIVPVFIMSTLLMAKGGEYESQANIFSIFISAILLGLSIISLIFRFEQKRESYIIGRRSNIYVASEALKNINEDDSNLTWFYNYQVEMDSKDRENIGNIPIELKQKAYRYSLERLSPGKSDTVCPICKASPFVFKKGACQTCGNTPKDQ
jgi:mobilome CxxCx(11)CxxC protein